MKFTEMPYHQIGLEQLVGQIKDITRKFNEAASAGEQLELIYELDKMLAEPQTMGNLAYVRYTLNTDDPYYQEQSAFWSMAWPRIGEAEAGFGRAVLSSPYRKELEKELGEQYFLMYELQLKGISEDIMELMQEESDLAARYQGVLGGAKVSYEGKEYTIAQMSVFLQNRDRNIRKAACAALGNLYESKRDEFEEIYENLVKNRTVQARRLGLNNYVDLAYIRHRRCFTREQAGDFRRLALKYILPAAVRLKQQQAERIQVDRLMYYDMGYVFPNGNPVPKGTPQEILEAGRKMYIEMSPETAEFIECMFEMELFDVLARPGKTMSGYCTHFPAYRCPFIFANFNGTAGDVNVLTHEAGHAFAFYTAAREIALESISQPTAEACEVHSMTMEFFAAPWYELFFREDTDKYTYSHLESTLDLILRGCLADHFQEEVYSHPEMSPEERNRLWKELEKMYRPYVNTDGVPFFEHGADWQRQHHFYTHPYYYIDYSLAQTVALQFWMEMGKNWPETWNKYLRFIRSGGTKSFLELVEAAGLKSPMDEECLKEIGGFLENWLACNAV